MQHMVVGTPEKRENKKVVAKDATIFQIGPIQYSESNIPKHHKRKTAANRLHCVQIGSLLPLHNCLDFKVISVVPYYPPTYLKNTSVSHISYSSNSRKQKGVKIIM